MSVCANRGNRLSKSNSSSSLNSYRRTPCGSGTSARLALLDRRDELPRGATLMHESVIGTRFGSRVVGEERVGDYPAVVTEIEGSAHLTGYHQFVLAADDPLGEGFLIR